MPIVISCTSCRSYLRTPDHALGKWVRCPKCRAVVPVRKEEEASDEKAIEQITKQPAPKPARDAEQNDRLGPATRPRRQQVKEIPLDSPDEEIVELDEVEEPPPEPRKKKRRKKKRLAPLPDSDEEREVPAWVWWAGGGSGIALTFLTLLILIVVTGPESKLKFYSAYLLVMLPVSTVIFFAAMILASVTLGAVEIGEIHVAIVKSFGLLLVVNLVNLIPFVGRYLTALVWIPGLMMLFRLDFWETCMVMLFNWVLNFLINLFLMAALASWIMHGGAGKNSSPDLSPSKSNAAGQGDVWDEDNVFELGGTVAYDPTNRDEPVVVGISFRGLPITDSDLAHMKDFPRLTRLDLASTRISDAGLRHLAACKSLQMLILTGTRVTPAGKEELQRALPRLQIVQ